jgi:hypothetical protein
MAAVTASRGCCTVRVVTTSLGSGSHLPRRSSGTDSVPGHLGLLPEPCRPACALPLVPDAHFVLNVSGGHHLARPSIHSPAGWRTPLPSFSQPLQACVLRNDWSVED